MTPSRPPPNSKSVEFEKHLTGLNMGLCRLCAWSVQLPQPGKGSFKTCQVLGDVAPFPAALHPLALNPLPFQSDYPLATPDRS